MKEMEVEDWGFRKVTVYETLDGGTESYWILIILGFCSWSHPWPFDV